jgi:hypothetical protein
MVPFSGILKRGNPPRFFGILRGTKIGMDIAGTKEMSNF